MYQSEQKLRLGGHTPEWQNVPHSFADRQMSTGNQRDAPSSEETTCARPIKRDRAPAEIKSGGAAQAQAQAAYRLSPRLRSKRSSLMGSGPRARVLQTSS
jgi:hypothetical protein